jgi:hypothetical protein
MSTPVRLQLSRKKGFDLQAHSRAVNGLPAVNVARPTEWGNPYKVRSDASHIGGTDRDRAQWCVDCYCDLISGKLLSARPRPTVDQIRTQLRGKNVACWCNLCAAHAKGKPLGIVCTACDPCHGDTLLELSNVKERADG